MLYDTCEDNIVHIAGPLTHSEHVDVDSCSRRVLSRATAYSAAAHFPFSSSTTLITINIIILVIVIAFILRATIHGRRNQISPYASPRMRNEYVNLAYFAGRRDPWQMYVSTTAVRGSGFDNILDDSPSGPEPAIVCVRECF